MFATPKPQAMYVPAADPIDVNQRYLFRLEKIEDKGVDTQFSDPNDPEAPHRLLWSFQMATLNKAPILNTEGDPYVHTQFTSNRTGKGGGKTAVARLWMEALLGRELLDSEIGPGLEDQLIGKVAVGLMEEKDAVSRGGEAYTRLNILRLSPYKEGAAAQAAEPASPKRENKPMPQAAAVAPAASNVPW